MKMKLFFLEKSCELVQNGSKIVKKSTNIKPNKIESSSILVQNGSI